MTCLRPQHRLLRCLATTTRARWRTGRVARSDTGIPTRMAGIKTPGKRMAWLRLSSLEVMPRRCIIAQGRHVNRHGPPLLLSHQPEKDYFIPPLLRIGLCPRNKNENKPWSAIHPDRIFEQCYRKKLTEINPEVRGCSSHSRDLIMQWPILSQNITSQLCWFGCKVFGPLYNIKSGMPYNCINDMLLGWKVITCFRWAFKETLYELLNQM